MKYLKGINLNLGIPSLIPEWKQLFNPKYLTQDLLAGTTVAFVAIPLSLAIALASGVSPGVGLITAVIAGIACALFGGAPLTVSGPAAAMSILVADIVERFGFTSLIFIGLLAGVMQLASGVFGLGRFSRYIPLPVIAGFTAGIGVIILIGQLPRAFGLPAPEVSHIFNVLYQFKEYYNNINGICLLLVILTIGIIRAMPKFLPRIPPILPAVALCTFIVYFFDLNDVPLIGNIPNQLPAPHFPTFPNIGIHDLIINAFTIYVLASLETLLSASSIDKLSHQKRHDPNQELIGQGIGNILVSLFSGMPVTGVIARSVTNVRAGAKTRRASIIHAAIILLAVYQFSSLISKIPVATLAGVLLSIAASMINIKEFKTLLKTTKTEASIYAITFLTIIFVDLTYGVQAGIAAAVLILVIKAARTHLMISTNVDDLNRFTLTGNLTFLSTAKIDQLNENLERLTPGSNVLVDLSGLQNIDTTGASAIIEMYNNCKEKNINFYIRGLHKKFEDLFKGCGGARLVDEYYLIYEHDLHKKAKENKKRSSRGRLIHGAKRYYIERKHTDKRLFEYITKKQDPHTLFITCSDSRIMPSMITCSDPGELFIIRNVGNFIPPYDPNSTHSEIAALEFALTNLDINDIVVCGHANCGAIQACHDYNPDKLAPQLKAWIDMIRKQLVIDNTQYINEIARANVLNQLQNLKQYPVVQRKIAMGTLNIHGWFFDFDKNLIFEWNSKEENFKSLIGDLVIA